MVAFFLNLVSAIIYHDRMMIIGASSSYFSSTYEAICYTSNTWLFYFSLDFANTIFLWECNWKSDNSSVHLFKLYIQRKWEWKLRNVRIPNYPISRSLPLTLRTSALKRKIYALSFFVSVRVLLPYMQHYILSAPQRLSLAEYLFDFILKTSSSGSVRSIKFAYLWCTSTSH